MATTTDLMRVWYYNVLGLTEEQGARLSQTDLQALYAAAPTPGGGGGTELTSYATQVANLSDYPDTFPPDLTSVTPSTIGAQPEIPVYANEAAVLTALGNGEISVGDIVAIESP